MGLDSKLLESTYFPGFLGGLWLVAWTCEWLFAFGFLNFEGRAGLLPSHSILALIVGILLSFLSRAIIVEVTMLVFRNV